MNSKWIMRVAMLLLIAGLLVLFRGGMENRTEGMVAQRSVIDSTGRSVMIPERPKAVIALNASNVDLYYAAGGSLIGRPDTEALPPDILNAVKLLPSVGTTPNPNMEQIIALKPDLVLGANVPFHHELVPSMEKAGIPILLQSLNTYQDILATIKFYGELTGNEALALQRVQQIDTRLKQLVASHQRENAPKVLIIWGSTESFNMATNVSFAGNLVSLLGGKNVVDGAENLQSAVNYVPLSMEYVAKMNPDVVLLITHSSADKVQEKFDRELKSHPAWQGLKAVREGRVHILPYQLFAVNPGTRVEEAMGILDNLLYREVQKP